jgi:PadR family transcriptional regulator, regulatory protein PadR
MNRSRALSPQALSVAGVLADADDWRHGYDLMSQAGVKSGTLYPLLMRLEAQGLLEARWVEAPHARPFAARKGAEGARSAARGSASEATQSRPAAVNL